MFTDESQEVAPETATEEEVESEAQAEEETSETADASVNWEAEAKKWKAIAERNKKRVKDAEKSTRRTDLITPDAPPSESVDERILLNQGMSAELLKELKRVARFNETDLITAQKDSMFISIKEKYEQEQRDKEASLGASKGSGAAKAKKTFSTPGLSEDDHRKLWQEAMGR